MSYETWISQHGYLAFHRWAPAAGLIFFARRLDQNESPAFLSRAWRRWPCLSGSAPSCPGAPPNWQLHWHHHCLKLWGALSTTNRWTAWQCDPFWQAVIPYLPFFDSWVRFARLGSTSVPSLLPPSLLLPESPTLSVFSELQLSSSYLMFLWSLYEM